MKRTLLLAAGALMLWACVRGAGAGTGCPEPELVSAESQNAGASTDKLTVVSINLGKETDAERIAAELEEQDLLDDLDVLSLQEVRREHPVAERLAERLEMSAVVAGTGSGGGENTDGLALLSRLPLRDAEVIRLPRNQLGVRSRCRVALAATVGNVRIVGLHLDTRINSKSRLRQIEPALEAVAQHSGPVVLAGDFNTNSFWWIEHLIPVPFVNDQAEALFHHLAGLGYRSPFSPGGQATNDFLGLQLDWVFLRGLKAREWGVEPLAFTDHHAVWVRASTR